MENNSSQLNNNIKILNGIDIINNLDTQAINDCIDKINNSINEVDNVLNEVFEKHLIYNSRSEASVKESWNFIKYLVGIKKMEIKCEK